MNEEKIIRHKMCPRCLSPDIQEVRPLWMVCFSCGLNFHPIPLDYPDPYETPKKPYRYIPPNFTAFKRILQAKKDHRCWRCGCLIPVGSSYFTSFMPHNGPYNYIKLCVKCLDEILSLPNEERAFKILDRKPPLLLI